MNSVNNDENGNEAANKAQISRRITKLQDLGSFEASLNAVKVDKTANGVNGT